MEYQRKVKDSNTQAANRVNHILRYALKIYDNQHDKTTKLSQTEYAVATYAALVILFEGDVPQINAFMRDAIGSNDTKFLALFEHFFHIGYGAAIQDVTTQKITIR